MFAPTRHDDLLHHLDLCHHIVVFVWQSKFRLLDVIRLVSNRLTVVTANVVTLTVIMMNLRIGRDIGATAISASGVGLVWTMQ